MSSRASLNHFYRTVWNHTLGCAVAVAENASSGGGRESGAIQSVVFPHQPVARLALLSLAVALGWGFTGIARANPTGGVAVVGQATFDYTQPNHLLVTTQNGAGTNYSAINWQSFSIPSGSSTRIQQPNASSMSINRVVTNTPTTLFGTLSSNGKIVLVNQSGIAVGQGAVVDTAGFTASTLAMSDADARAGRTRFAVDGAAPGALNVQGQVIGRNGDVVLVAPSVEVAQSAVIEAPNGAVILAAGQNVDVTGRGLEGIRLNVQAPQDQALNLGTLKGDAVGIFAGTLKHSGAINATQASVDGGRVVLKASGDAFIEGNGRIVATRADGLGGAVQVLGNRVGLTDNASIDTSAVGGGGTILVGGDAHGTNPAVPNAQVAYIDANARLAADATEKGDGGKVVVWADDVTQFNGKISAKGGAQGGNGGWVETSGKRTLGFAGLVDTTAAKGSTGSLLLDPSDITIGFTNWPVATLSGGVFTFPSDANGTMTPSTITTQLASSNVTIDTTSAMAGSGDIYVNNGVTWGSGNTLKLKATSGIYVSAPISGTGATVAMQAGSAGITNTGPGTISADKLEIISGGNVSLTGANAVRVNTIASNVTGTTTIESYAPGSSLTIGSVGSTTGMASSGALTLYEYSTGANIVVNANVSGGGAGLTKIGQTTTSGTLTVASGKTVSGYDTELYAAGGVSINGTMSGSNTATLHTGLGGGAISTGSSGLISAPTITLQNDPSTVGSIGSAASPLRTSGTNVYIGAASYGPSGVYIKHTGTLHLKTANIQSSAPVQIVASGDIGLYTSINTGATGTALILAAGGNVTDNGNDQYAPNGRWLVYSTKPSLNSLTASGGSGLKQTYSFSQYGSSYGSAIQASGNGLIYSWSPSLTVGTPAALDKVYDGKASSSVATASLGLSGFEVSNVNTLVGSDSITSTNVTANYPSRNVGTGLAVTYSDVTAQDSAGKPVYGYVIPGGSATISQRPLSIWTGAFNNQWANPLNWDALPDANNVLAVSIPAGTNVVFDTSVAPTVLKTLTSASPVTIAGSSLQISDGFTVAGYSQTGGLLSGKGTFSVNGSFNQIAGKLDWGDIIAVIAPSGNIVFNDLKAPGVNLTATTGSITGNGGVVTDGLVVVTGAGAVMNSVDNRIKTFKATNTGSGNIELTNVGALNVQGINNVGGGIVMNNTGGITTTGPVTAPSAVGISLTANSPLTIGADGLSSGGNVVLAATNLTSAGNVTINGPVTSTGGTVALNAANDMTQNAVVYGAKGVTVKVGGTLTLTAAAKAGAAPVSYFVGGSSVTPPPSTDSAPSVDPLPPTATDTGVFDRVQDAIAQTNLLTTFLDKFELAVQQQNDDPNDKDRNRRGLVVEGDVCTR